MVPILVGLALVRLAPARLPALVPVSPAERPALVRQAGALLAIAVLFAALVPFLGPLAGSRDLSAYREYDRVYLAVAMVFAFVTAAVAEEVFYRAWLQTRLEALHGRWVGITASALLFAAMHVHRLGDGTLWISIATILASNGGFGLLTGYLWARYRNLWANIAIHGAVNAAALLPM